MKHTLKNRPNPWLESAVDINEWFEGFEKELRELAEIYDKSDYVEHWAILQFIKKGILGE